MRQFFKQIENNVINKVLNEKYSDLITPATTKLFHYNLSDCVEFFDFIDNQYFEEIFVYDENEILVADLINIRNGSFKLIDSLNELSNEYDTHSKENTLEAFLEPLRLEMKSLENNKTRRATILRLMFSRLDMNEYDFINSYNITRLSELLQQVKFIDSFEDFIKLLDVNSFLYGKIDKFDKDTVIKLAYSCIDKLEFILDVTNIPKDYEIDFNFFVLQLIENERFMLFNREKIKKN